MVKRLCLILPLLFSACQPIPLGNASNVSQTQSRINLRIQWPQKIVSSQNFTTLNNFEEIKAVGVQRVRVRLRDSAQIFVQEVDFEARSTDFKDFLPGLIHVDLECLNADGKVLFKGSKTEQIAETPMQGAIDRVPNENNIRTKQTITVAVDQLLALDNFEPKQPDFKNSLDMNFKRIEPGTFNMNSTRLDGTTLRNELQKEITIDQAFYLQTTEVTREQWRHLMEEEYTKVEGSGEEPKAGIAIEQAYFFIEKLNQRGEGTYRLPTEAEWEYAARAGSSENYACGDSESCLSEMAWYSGNAKYGLPLVASKKPNAWGLFDMHGSVSEWATHWLKEDGTPLGETIVYGGLRGGNIESTAQDVRSGSRNTLASGHHESFSAWDYIEYAGFRLVFTPPNQDVKKQLLVRPVYHNSDKGY